MKIRKTQQPSSYPTNSIHDSYNTAATDTYSCHYLNDIADKMNLVKLYDDDSGTSSLTLDDNYQILFVRVGASTSESQIVSIVDTNRSIYKYISTHDENYSMTFGIVYNRTTKTLTIEKRGISGWSSSIGAMFSVYGLFKVD